MQTPLELSQTVEYALRATLHVARHASSPVRLPEIAAAIRAPQRYLGKILGQLARAGLLTSARGPAGGFRLAPHAQRAPLSAIVAVFETPERRRCLLGHGVCGHNPHCPVHERWAPIAQATSDFFAHTTVGDLVGPPAQSPHRSLPTPHPCPSTLQR